MIKKKNSILTITVLSILGVVVLGVNLSQYLRNRGGFQQIDRPNAEAIEKVKERRNQQTTPSGGSMPILASATGLEEASKKRLASTTVPENPSIVIPSMKQYKQEPNDNTASPQWYKDNSYEKSKAEKEGNTYSGQ